MNGIVGIDIGGTKCAVSIAKVIDKHSPPSVQSSKDGQPNQHEQLHIIEKRKFLTPPTPEETLNHIIEEVQQLIDVHQIRIKAIGVSCGGPLDSRRGVILSPPNLPGWDEIDIITPLQAEFGAPARIQNDANACALAEWKWGAGRGCRNMIFLTFGTGMGAGLILNGELYSGTNDFAGEVGHIRLEDDGPIGFGKPGSFEGFCSGGGIAKLARSMAEEQLQNGQSSFFCQTATDLDHITAEKVGRAAQEGDPLALEVFQIVSRNLGKGLALLVDILNPERIIIGSIYGRQQSILEPMMQKVLQREALSHSLAVCEIVPAGLGERVGDYAGLSVAVQLSTRVEL